MNVNTYFNELKSVHVENIIINKVKELIKEIEEIIEEMYIETNMYNFEKMRKEINKLKEVDQEMNRLKSEYAMIKMFAYQEINAYEEKMNLKKIDDSITSIENNKIKNLKNG